MFRSRNLIIIAALLSVISVLAVARVKTPVKKAKSVTDKPLLIEATNPVVTVKLSANPSTGYRWLLVDYNPYLIIPISAKFYPPKETKGRVGVPGTTVWQFRIKPDGFKVPQLIKIQMRYARPGTANGGKLKVLTLVTQPLDQPTDQPSNDNS